MAKVAGAQNFDGRNWYEQHTAKARSCSSRAARVRIAICCSYQFLPSKF